MNKKLKYKYFLFSYFLFLLLLLLQAKVNNLILHTFCKTGCNFTIKIYLFHTSITRASKNCNKQWKRIQTRRKETHYCMHLLVSLLCFIY